MIMPPRRTKTRKIEESSDSESDSSEIPNESDLVKLFENEREKTAVSILEFRFAKSRVRILNNMTEVKLNSNGILYWMFRDQRVQDNWAFLFAQKLAFKNQVPLHICFCLLPNFQDANMRQYKFLVKGLQEIEDECNKLNISFHLFYGNGGEEVLKFVRKHNMGAVVCDLSPLREPLQRVENLKKVDVPVIQVEAHNIVPVWITSDKQENTPHFFRKKIFGNLDEYLTAYPPVVRHPHKSVLKNVPKNDWINCWKHVEVDDLEEVDWATPGYKGGIRQLQIFCLKRLKDYASKRNDPLADVQSDLSPWLHFGQISPQRCILQVTKYKNKYKESVEAYREEAIMRRELSDNFCFYNSNYDSLEGCPDWAKQTLNDHRNDKREWIYSVKEFNEAKTHDDLWNSAQIQLIKEGKMHWLLRVYWAKRILEWSETPEKALSAAIYLNDRYSLDGHDPNGYVGCLYSIGGLHDHGWFERDIFGKILFMNYQGCKTKFDVKAFIARYGEKVHKST